MKKAMTAIIAMISLITAMSSSPAQGKCESLSPCDGIRGNTETPYDILWGSVKPQPVMVFRESVKCSVDESTVADSFTGISNQHK
jgi:hypothetical protein